MSKLIIMEMLLRGDNMFFKKKKKYLKREELIGFADSDKIWRKQLSMKEAYDLVVMINEKLEEYDYEEDENFIMDGRRLGLMNNIVSRIANNNDGSEEVVLESLFNLWEFVNNEYDGSFVEAAQTYHKTNAELSAMSNTYRQKGIICLQEKQYINVMLDVIRARVFNILHNII